MIAMTAVRANAPTLAWLLTALTCLLTGMAIVESRQHATLAAIPPAVIAESVEIAAASTPVPAPPSSPAALFEDIPIPSSNDPSTLRVARLTVRPEGSLPSEMASGPTAIMIESGTISIWVDGAVLVGQGLDAAQTETVLGAGEWRLIAPDTRYHVRNDGPAPAVALVASIDPGGASSGRGDGRGGDA
jgi:hypothetical protein